MATADDTPPPAAPATPDTSLRGRLTLALDNVKALSQQQKIAAGVIVALVFAFIVAALLWHNQPERAVLFANYDERDGGEILAALQQQNVPYTFSDNGKAILVDAKAVHETRLRLAALGLPKGGMVGFEIMDVQKLGVSQFNEQITYQRALEGELARTIQSISSVAAARVHLAIPKQTAFLRDDQKPSASVMVQLLPGRQLDDNQVAGIVHLVASSVPRMSDKGVTIIDQTGDLLTGEDPLKRSGLDPTQLRYVEEVEAALIRRIENILTPMFGKENFRAQVAADVDFNDVEQTAETYRPNPPPDTALRSQQTTEQENRDAGPQGVPGALTNQPPVPATAPITTPPVPPQGGPGGREQRSLSRTATLNYELDRTIQHIKQATGQLKRLSVAVVINRRPVPTPDPAAADAQAATPATPRTPPAAADKTATPPPNDTISEEEIARITQLVRDAAGYSEKRGDTISVTGSPFNIPTPTTGLPIWKDPEMVQIGKDGGKYLLIALGIFIFYLVVIRPLMRVIIPPAPKEEPGSADSESGEDEDGVDVELSDAARPESYEARLERARQMARDDPKNVAELIKQWMGVTGEGAHK